MDINIKHKVYIYRIDINNYITSVSDSWKSFAEENQGGHCCTPELILNKSLWDFISDIETRHLYKVLVDKVRDNQSAVTIPIRCDSPDKRRFMNITILPLPENSVEFKSEVIKIEERDAVDLLKCNQERSGEFLKMCSYCKKVAVSEERWVEVEHAIKILDLFGDPKLPEITHGICPSCFQIVMAEIEKFKH